jgi:molybdopterin-guanine dinucleotide biosynthesis protein A
VSADLEAVILAGGRSTRFGSDKAAALLRGRPLLQWVAEALGQVAVRLVIVRAVGQALPALDAPVPVTIVDDEYPGLGPLAGLATGLAGCRAEFAFACSCDAPLISPALVERLAAIARAEQADIVCPDVAGYPQPLVAVYRVATCAPAFRRAVEERTGGLRIVAAYDGLRVAQPGAETFRDVDPALQSFLNANTPARLAEIDRLLG